VGGDKGTGLRARLLKLWEGRNSPPLQVEPRHRISGPIETPSDWWNRPEMVWPQCNLCHTRILTGMPALEKGLCGPCKQRQHEAPDAA
jgi:hypothetical protein